MPNSVALQVFYGTLPAIFVMLLVLVWLTNLCIGDLSKRVDDLRVSLAKQIDDLDKRVERR